jgi:DNA-directed RNA polymerase subunit RPC12/RpoP
MREIAKQRIDARPHACEDNTSQINGGIMAGGIVITCPECQKKFKPKADVQGKKIKCPFCAHPFVVPAAKGAKTAPAKNGKAKPAPAKNGKAKPDAKPAAAAAAAAGKSQAEQDLETDENPYGVKNVDLVPRCPNCTEEMENEHAVICLNCGYNTLTREWGRTEKTLGITFERQLTYMLPALGAAAFAVFTIIGLVYSSTVAPYDVAGTMMSFSDHESIRMWSTVFWLFVVWTAGMFCFKKFIEKPKPDEISLD